MSTIQLQVANPPSAADWAATSATSTTIPILRKPVLSTVATSGKFDDLTGNVTATNITSTGTVIMPAPVAATWYGLSSITIPANTAVTPSTWTLQSWSKVPTGVTLLNASNQLVIPYSGVYSLCFGVRWNTATGENSTWIQSVSGTYGNNNGATFRFCASDSTTGAVVTNGSYTGYFAAGDVVVPQAYCSTANTLVNQYGGIYMSMSLITRTA